MAYSVQYEPEWNSGHHAPKKKRINRWLCIAVVLVIFLLGAFSGIRHWLWDFLIPGDPKITVAAFENLLGDLSAGKNFSKAVFCFGREILTHA